MSGDTGSTPVRDPGGPVNTRDEVLAAIRTAPTPPTVDEIARSLDLHPNSVRLHAAALRDSGLITQDSRPGGGRGRPQTTYRTSARGAWTGRPPPGAWGGRGDAGSRPTGRRPTPATGW